MLHLRYISPLRHRYASVTQVESSIEERPDSERRATEAVSASDRQHDGAGGGDGGDVEGEAAAGEGLNALRTSAARMAAKSAAPSPHLSLRRSYNDMKVSRRPSSSPNATLPLHHSYTAITLLLRRGYVPRLPIVTPPSHRRYVVAT